VSNSEGRPEELEFASSSRSRQLATVKAQQDAKIEAAIQAQLRQVRESQRLPVGAGREIKLAGLGRGRVRTGKSRRLFRFAMEDEHQLPIAGSKIAGAVAWHVWLV
jgi:hypothetical protein